MTKATKSMRIYRFQTEDGVGPCFGGHVHKYPEELRYTWYSGNLPDGSERREHPDADIGTALAQAYWDKKIYRGGPLRFGFVSKEHLHTWYSPADIGWKETNGYFIHIFEVPEEKIICGTRQVCFDPKDAISVKKINHKQLRRI